MSFVQHARLLQTRSLASLGCVVAWCGIGGMQLSGGFGSDADGNETKIPDEK